MKPENSSDNDGAPNSLLREWKMEGGVVLAAGIRRASPAPDCAERNAGCEPARAPLVAVTGCTHHQPADPLLLEKNKPRDHTHPIG
jgi:hypothetical protein